jgi:hypothetical protein
VAFADPASQPVRPIAISELRARGIEGRLGSPLGTILEVSGIVVANTSRAKADISEPFFLRIEEVNGKKLDPPEELPSRNLPLAHLAPELKVGDRFHCVGYETGGFEGTPPGVFDYVTPYPATGFGFALRFVPIKLK